MLLGAEMIQVTDSISLHENEIQLDFVRASGPGGQNINKVSSAVQLRFDAAQSSALSEEIRTRLKQISGHRE
jgi:ribosome-associated protein